MVEVEGHGGIMMWRMLRWHQTGSRLRCMRLHWCLVTQSTYTTVGIGQWRILLHILDNSRLKQSTGYFSNILGCEIRFSVILGVTIWEVCDILRISGWKHPTERRSDLIEVTSKLSFGSTLFLPSASYGIDSLDTVVIGSRVFIKCKIVPRFSGLFFFRRQSWCWLCAWWIGCCRYCLLTLIRDLSLKAISLLRYSVLSIRFISFHCPLIIYLLRRYYFLGSIILNLFSYPHI